ncbi:MAG: major tail protein [Candidatus Dehalobacter alkaniphilus]
MPETYKYDEYQGFDSLFAAEITLDDATAYTAGTPFALAPAGEIAVKTDRASAPKYYDNQAYLVVTAEGFDEATLTVPVLPISLIARLLGKVVDPTTGALLDTGETLTKYFAIGYRLQFTDGTYRYVWRHKGTFRLDEESAKAKDNSTDTNNHQLIFTGITTKFKFTMPDASKKPGKQIVVDARDGKADVSSWFTQVVTPENLTAITPTP